MSKKKAKINNNCICCGRCYDVCPLNAINEGGCKDGVLEEDIDCISCEHYFVKRSKCVGCGLCAESCPVDNIVIEDID